MIAIVVLLAACFIAAFLFRGSYIPAWIMLAAAAVLLLMFYRGRQVQCPVCRQPLNKYIDIEADTEDTYGFIYVCMQCRYYFKDLHRVGSL
jgi:hypothetical protein